MDDFGEAETAGRRTRAADILLLVDNWRAIFWCLTVVVANSVAGTLSAFPREAGAASAVLGAVHYGAGIFSAALLGWIADGTPWPMGLVIGAAGVLSLVSSLPLVGEA